ncbi:hypothetical protein [Streptomyces hydrogenans]
MSNERTKRNRNQHTVRRMARAAVFGLVRGSATAVGSAAVAWVVWWMQQ